METVIDIRALRQRIGLTQKQLAEAVQVTPNTVARWERGELAMSAPMQDRLERVASSHRSGSVVTRSSAITLDPHHQAILDALNGRLDPKAFEECATALLRQEWPTLVPVGGGRDDGFDGAVAGRTGEPFPLIVTTGARLVDNLSRNLDRASLRWNFASALFATSRRITATIRHRLFEAARARGVKLRQTYHQDWFAQRLYREPEWCRRLLGVTGRPAALSLFPVSWRPMLGDAVLGREREMSWLQEHEGDCLLVGEPGSGKTFLLRSLALQGDARFLVDQDRTQIANDLRSLRPAAVIVDDAHVRPDQIAELDQIRSEVGAEFRIVATSWPGAADAVRSALKIGRNAERQLGRLDADTMIEIIKSIGIQGPDRLLWVIRKQAAGRPGLAATLAHLCLAGSVQDVFSGDALLAELARGIDWMMDDAGMSLLAPFALGGAAGVRQEPASQRLERSLYSVHRGLAKLAAAGVIRERENRAISVEPDPIRWIIVKRVFYDGPAALDIGRFLEIVEDRQDALHTLIGARSRGAAIPDLEDRLELAGSPELWAAYARLGPVEARHALGTHPELIHEIARSALLNAPETAIPMLLDRMVDDRGRLGQSSEQCIDKLEEWTKGSESDGARIIERRSALVRATAAWWKRSRNGEPAIRTFCVALLPGVDYSVLDPGIGNTITRKSRMLSDNDLRALVELWPEVLIVVRESERVPWRELFDLMGAWLRPELRFFPPVKFDRTTDDILRTFANTMIEDLATISRRHPGVQHRIGRLAHDIPRAPELCLDPQFEVLYPSESTDPEDRRRERRQWYDELVELADNWASRPLEDVASFLKCCEDEAHLAGIDHRRLSPDFCAQLARRVSDPVAAAEALVSHALPAALVTPFLRRAAVDCQPGWTRLTRRFLAADEYRWIAVETVLRQPAAPSDLFAAALSRAVDMPHLEDFLGTWCDEIAEPAIRSMLQSNAPRIAVATAVSYWRERQRDVPESHRAAWRWAVLRSARDGGRIGQSTDYWLGEILSDDSDLAVDWLVSNMTDDSYSQWMTSDVAKTATKSLGQVQRQDVLTRLDAAGAVYAVPEVIKSLVHGDLGLYRQLLDSTSLKDHHLDPLEGSPDATWRLLAVAALDRGYSVRDILDATTGGIRTWSGPTSAMWAAERRELEALLNDSDVRIAAVGRAGMEYASAREHDASLRETTAAVEGRP